VFHQGCLDLETVGFDPLMHAATATWPHRPSCTHGIVRTGCAPVRRSPARKLGIAP